MIINRLLLTIITAVSPVAARLLAAGSERTLVGGDYCVWGPNTTCYSSGWPLCCQLPNHTSVCPEDPPPCEDIAQDGITSSTTSTPPMLIGNYCTLSPEDDCYISGWPLCCETKDCPVEPPPCEILTPPPYYYPTSTPTTAIATPPTTPPPFSWSEATAPPNTSPSIWAGEPSSKSGAPYCFVQDFDCYLEGVPECCKEDATNCDALITPECDNVESSTTGITETSSTVLLTTPTETTEEVNETISDGGEELSTTTTDTEPTVATLDDSSIEDTSVGPTYSPTPTPQSAAFRIASSTVSMTIAALVGVIVTTFYVIDI